MTKQLTEAERFYIVAALKTDAQRFHQLRNANSAFPEMYEQYRKQCLDCEALADEIEQAGTITLCKRIVKIVKAALNVDGKIYHSTYKGQEQAEETAARVNGEVRPYGVAVKRMLPPDGLVTEWEKYPGFSVWI